MSVYLGFIKLKCKEYDEVKQFSLLNKQVTDIESAMLDAICKLGIKIHENFV